MVRVDCPMLIKPLVIANSSSVPSLCQCCTGLTLAIVLLSCNLCYAEHNLGINYLDLSIQSIAIGGDYRSNKSSKDIFTFDDYSYNAGNSKGSTANIKIMTLDGDISQSMLLHYEESGVDRRLNQDWIHQQQNNITGRSGGKAINYLARKTILRWWMDKNNNEDIDLKVIKIDRDGKMGYRYQTGFKYKVKVGTDSSLAPDQVDFKLEYQF